MEEFVVGISLPLWLLFGWLFTYSIPLFKGTNNNNFKIFTIFNWFSYFLFAWYFCYSNNNYIGLLLYFVGTILGLIVIILEKNKNEKN